MRRAAVSIAVIGTVVLGVAPGLALRSTQIQWLAPSEFGSLSESIRQELTRRGCEIPQVWSAKAPGNVIVGRFTTPDQVDVAALCSRDGRSTILVFENGTSNRVRELEPRADEDFMQATGGTPAVGFSRAIGTATPGRIVDALRRHKRTDHPPITHDGIEDIFVEKASAIWYWHDGKWVQLPGSD
jgi:hypothetical protein